VKELTHSDSPLQEGLALAIAIYDQADVTVDSTEVLSNEGNVAIVEVEVTASIDGQENTDTSEMELHTEDGDWKVWNFGSGDGDGTTTA
jgi:ABC-type transporter MlaC component